MELEEVVELTLCASFTNETLEYFACKRPGVGARMRVPGGRA